MEQAFKWAKEALMQPKEKAFVDYLQRNIDQITHKDGERTEYEKGKLNAYLDIRWVIQTGGLDIYRFPAASRLFWQGIRHTIRNLFV